jgi:hypothetical protein
MTRLETLVDAAFAFSVTMLALSPDRVPTTFAEMYDLLRGVPAFVFSLAMLLLFWNGHVVFSRRYGLDDGPTTAPQHRVHRGHARLRLPAQVHGDRVLRLLHPAAPHAEF